MIKAHKVKLYPTRSQEILFRKSCGVARFSYNWALTKWDEQYKSGDNPSAYNLIKLITSIKKDQFPFFLEVSKTAPQYAIHNLEGAFKSFFKGYAKYPKFKKKGVKDSFIALDNNVKFKQNNYKIWIPRIGWIKCAENLRFKGKVIYVVISRIANIWFASINIEMSQPAPIIPIVGDNQAIGVDLGISSMMILSNGTFIENPRALRNNLKRLKKYQRRLSKKKKGSNNRRKQQIKLSRAYYRVSCIRRNAIHQATTMIVKKYDKIIIEDLNVIGMVKNRNLAQAVSDIAFGEISRQFQYKSSWYGKELIVADRWYASSKTCSNCGNKKKNMSLSERIYKCDHCGLKINRDLNAAKNLASYGPTPKYGESQASGFGSSVAEMQHSLKLNEEIK
jgi:putative transposase